MSRNHTRLDGRRWARTRQAAFERDSYRCRNCGGAGRLEAHHSPPLRKGADPYDVSGIVSMCRTCHIEKHRPDDMTEGRAEWREFVAKIAEGA